MPSKRVLIIDPDLGFVFWLGQMLDAEGYQALPAKSIADARRLLNQLRFEVDLLVINAALENARAFGGDLLRSQGRLKILAISNSQDGGSGGVPEADESRGKPSLWDEASKTEWLDTITRLLSSDTSTAHRNHA